MSSLHTSIIPSPLGPIGLSIQNQHLTALEMLPHSTAPNASKETFAQRIEQELQHYFANPEHSFTFKWEMRGTLFQQRVWQALCTIPCGKTLTYGQLAKQLNTSPRAVGQACRTNPLPIVVPCHRIVASQHLGGYAGATDGRLLAIKKWLLQHEKMEKRTD